PPLPPPGLSPPSLRHPQNQWEFPYLLLLMRLPLNLRLHLHLLLRLWPPARPSPSQLFLRRRTRQLLNRLLHLSPQLPPRPRELPNRALLLLSNETPSSPLVWMNSCLTLPWMCRALCLLCCKALVSVRSSF